jgi:hypothetical protein
MIITKLNMQIIPRSQMRTEYATGWGDYWLDEDGVLQVRAVEMPNLMWSHYILLHEYMEAVRCYRDGISLESIEAWDLSHPEADDPGSLPGCPYWKHHAFSMMLENIACIQDGHDWDEYNNSSPIGEENVR